MDGTDADGEWSDEDGVKSGSATALSDNEPDELPRSLTITKSVASSTTQKKDPVHAILDRIDAELGVIAAANNINTFSQPQTVRKSPYSIFDRPKLEAQGVLFDTTDITESNKKTGHTRGGSSDRDTGVGTGSVHDDAGSEHKRTAAPVHSDVANLRDIEGEDNVCKGSDTHSDLDSVAAQQIDEKFKEIMRKKRGGYLDDLRAVMPRSASEQDTVKSEEGVVRVGQGVTELSPPTSRLFASSGSAPKLPPQTSQLNTGYASDLESVKTEDFESRFQDLMITPASKESHGKHKSVTRPYQHPENTIPKLFHNKTKSYPTKPAIEPKSFSSSTLLSNYKTQLKGDLSKRKSAYPTSLPATQITTLTKPETKLSRPRSVSPARLSDAENKVLNQCDEVQCQETAVLFSWEDAFWKSKNMPKRPASSASTFEEVESIVFSESSSADSHRGHKTGVPCWNSFSGRPVLKQNGDTVSLEGRSLSQSSTSSTWDDLEASNTALPDNAYVEEIYQRVLDWNIASWQSGGSPGDRPQALSLERASMHMAPQKKILIIPDEEDNDIPFSKMKFNQKPDFLSSSRNFSPEKCQQKNFNPEKSQQYSSGTFPVKSPSLSLVSSSSMSSDTDTFSEHITNAYKVLQNAQLLNQRSQRSTSFDCINTVPSSQTTQDCFAPVSPYVPVHAERMLYDLGFSGADSLLPERFLKDWQQKMAQARAGSRSCESEDVSSIGFQQSMPMQSTRTSEYTYNQQDSHSASISSQLYHESKDAYQKVSPVEPLARDFARSNLNMWTTFSSGSSKRRRQWASSRQKSLPLFLETLNEEDETKSPIRNQSPYSQLASVKSDCTKLPLSKESSQDSNNLDSESDSFSSCSERSCAIGASVKSKMSSVVRKSPSIVVSDYDAGRGITSLNGDGLYSLDSLEVADIMQQQIPLKKNLQISATDVYSLDVNLDHDASEDLLKLPHLSLSRCSSSSTSPGPLSPVTVIEVKLDNQQDSLDTDESEPKDIDNVPKRIEKVCEFSQEEGGNQMGLLKSSSTRKECASVQTNNDRLSPIHMFLSSDDVNLKETFGSDQYYTVQDQNVQCDICSNHQFEDKPIQTDPVIDSGFMENITREDIYARSKYVQVEAVNVLSESEGRNGKTNLDVDGNNGNTKTLEQTYSKALTSEMHVRKHSITDDWVIKMFKEERRHETDRTGDGKKVEEDEDCLSEKSQMMHKQFQAGCLDPPLPDHCANRNDISWTKLDAFACEFLREAEEYCMKLKQLHHQKMAQTDKHNSVQSASGSQPGHVPVPVEDFQQRVTNSDKENLSKPMFDISFTNDTVGQSKENSCIVSHEQVPIHTSKTQCEEVVFDSHDGNCVWIPESSPSCRFARCVTMSDASSSSKTGHDKNDIYLIHSEDETVSQQLLLSPSALTKETDGREASEKNVISSSNYHPDCNPCHQTTEMPSHPNSSFDGKYNQCLCPLKHSILHEPESGSTQFYQDCNQNGPPMKQKFNQNTGTHSTLSSRRIQYPHNEPVSKYDVMPNALKQDHLQPIEQQLVLASADCDRDPSICEHFGNDNATGNGISSDVLDKRSVNICPFLEIPEHKIRTRQLSDKCDSLVDTGNQAFLTNMDASSRRKTALLKKHRVINDEHYFDVHSGLKGHEDPGNPKCSDNDVIKLADHNKPAIEFTKKQMTTILEHDIDSDMERDRYSHIGTNQKTPELSKTSSLQCRPVSPRHESHKPPKSQSVCDRTQREQFSKLARNAFKASRTTKRVLSSEHELLNEGDFTQSSDQDLHCLSTRKTKSVNIVQTGTRLCRTFSNEMVEPSLEKKQLKQIDDDSTTVTCSVHEPHTDLLFPRNIALDQSTQPTVGLTEDSSGFPSGKKHTFDSSTKKSVLRKITKRPGLLTIPNPVLNEHNSFRPINIASITDPPVQYTKPSIKNMYDMKSSSSCEDENKNASGAQKSREKASPIYRSTIYVQRFPSQDSKICKSLIEVGNTSSRWPLPSSSSPISPELPKESFLQLPKSDPQLTRRLSMCSSPVPFEHTSVSSSPSANESSDSHEDQDAFCSSRLTPDSGISSVLSKSFLSSQDLHQNSDIRSFSSGLLEEPKSSEIVLQSLLNVPSVSEDASLDCDPEEQKNVSNSVLCASVQGLSPVEPSEQTTKDDENLNMTLNHNVKSNNPTHFKLLLPNSDDLPPHKNVGRRRGDYNSVLQKTEHVKMKNGPVSIATSGTQKSEMTRSRARDYSVLYKKDIKRKEENKGKDQSPESDSDMGPVVSSSWDDDVDSTTQNRAEPVGSSALSASAPEEQTKAAVGAGKGIKAEFGQDTQKSKLQPQDIHSISPVVVNGVCENPKDNNESHSSINRGCPESVQLNSSAARQQPQAGHDMARQKKTQEFVANVATSCSTGVHVQPSVKSSNSECAPCVDTMNLMPHTSFSGRVLRSLEIHLKPMENIRVVDISSSGHSAWDADSHPVERQNNHKFHLKPKTQQTLAVSDIKSKFEETALDCRKMFVPKSKPRRSFSSHIKNLASMFEQS